MATTYADALSYIEDLGSARTGAIGRWDPPTMVLTDGAPEVVGGVKAFWNAGVDAACGPGTTRPFYKRCEA